MQPTILITRPDPENAHFADLIRKRLGCAIDLEISPLMRIEFCGNLPGLSQYRTLIFTSRNGVRAFASKAQRRDIPCYCVGDATERLAVSQGFVATSAGGTADDLIARMVKENPRAPCLHIRGEHAVGDVARRLTSAGIPTTEFAAYRQIPLNLTDNARALFSGKSPVILPLFSPRTARLLPEPDRVTTKVLVAALSENVAAALPDWLCQSVSVAKKPDLSAMLDVVEALADPGKALERGNLAQ